MHKIGVTGTSFTFYSITSLDCLVAVSVEIFILLLHLAMDLYKDVLWNCEEYQC